VEEERGKECLVLKKTQNKKGDKHNNKIMEKERKHHSQTKQKK
jgi:hypothetical protein